MCGGIAEYLNADPTVVRVVWVLITLFPGTLPVGLIGCLVAWLIMPEGGA